MTTTLLPRPGAAPADAHPDLVTTAELPVVPDADGLTVAALLEERLAALGERIARDGIDAHADDVQRLADAVRPRSRVLAEVLAGRFVAPMRERAFARAVRLVLLRPADHVALAVALP